jgi:hypothetical protein
MNLSLDQEKWTEIKIRLKKEFPYLTNADLHSRDDDDDNLLAMIANMVGKTKKEIREIIEKE